MRRRLAGLAAIATAFGIGISAAAPASADVARRSYCNDSTLVLRHAGGPDQCFTWNGHGSHYLPVNDTYTVFGPSGTLVYWVEGNWCAPGPLSSGFYCNGYIDDIYVP